MDQIPPQAYAPIVVEADPVRCQPCNKMLAELATAPWRIKCQRCGALNWATSTGQQFYDQPTKQTRAVEWREGEPNG